MKRYDHIIFYALVGLCCLGSRYIYGEGKLETKGKHQVMKNLGVSEDIIDEVTGGIVIEDIVEPISEYHYASFSKGDPFIAPLVLKEDSKFDMEEVPIVSPLQNYELSALKLVGVWQSDQNVKKGLIMTEEKEGVIIKVGDPIGRHGGKVLVVGDQSITVREIMYSPDGLRQFEDVEMPLQRSDAEEGAGSVRPAIKLLPGLNGAKGDLGNNPGGVNGAPAGNLGLVNGEGGGMNGAMLQKGNTPQMGNAAGIPELNGNNPLGGNSQNKDAEGIKNTLKNLPPETLNKIIEATQSQPAPFPYEGEQ